MFRLKNIRTIVIVLMIVIVATIVYSFELTYTDGDYWEAAVDIGGQQGSTSVIIIEDTVFVGGTTTLYALNVSDKSNIVELSNWTNDASICSSGLGGFETSEDNNTLFATCPTRGRFMVFNITDHSNIDLITSILNTSVFVSSWQVTLNDDDTDIVYVSNFDYDSITTINVSDITSPKIYSILTNATHLDNIRQIEYIDGIIYGVSFNGAVLFLNTSADKWNPNIIDYVDLDETYFAEFAFQNDYMFLTNYITSRIYSVNVTDFSSPFIVSNLSDTDFCQSPRTATINNNSFYTTCSNSRSISVYDITDPTDVTQLFSYSEIIYNNGPQNVVINGNDLFCPDGGNDTIVGFAIDESTDSCSCPGADTNWEINASDYCGIVDACDIGTGNINFTGTGEVSFDATITAANMDAPPSGVTLWINSSGNLQITS